MNTRARFWRVAVWISLAFAVVMGAAEVGTRGRGGYLVGGGGGVIGFSNGSLYCGRLAAMAQQRWRHWTFDMGGSMPWWEYTVYSVGTRIGPGWTVTVDFALPAGGGLALAVLSAWRLRRGRFGPGRCSRCGYSRAGLAASGVCPECGGA